MDKIKRIQLIVKSITAAVILFAVIFTVNFVRILEKNRVILPWNIKWNESDFREGDAILVVKNKGAIVMSGDEVIWQSEEGVRVSDGLLIDIDGDLENELIILCWRKGKYGKHKPFWIKKDESFWSQHIYIYDFNKKKNEIRPKWMASDIGFTVAFWEYDGSCLILTDKDNGKKSKWMWKSWGLERVE